MSLDLEEVSYIHGSPVDKAARYGWQIKDAQGELQCHHKDSLQIDKTYQRDGSDAKIGRMTQNWSWLACGVLIVARRPDRSLWVIDGQHRLLAARRHSGIQLLPCIVFEAAEVSIEARGFLDVNGNRKPVTAMQKQRALVAVGDEIAVFIEQEVLDCGLVLDKHSPNGVAFVSMLKKCAAQNRDNFTKTLQACAGLCLFENVKPHARLFAGLWHLQRAIGGLDDARFVARINAIGARRLIDAANRAAALVGHGQNSVLANGMLAEINKGLRHKFTLEGSSND
jgi:hypothetical protein